MAILEDLRASAHNRLAGRHLVGRSRACHLQIANQDVSGVHAEIVWDGAGWQLRDLGSRNGTYLDGRKLASGEQIVLTRGCVLAFGTTSLRYRLVDDGAPCLMALLGSGESVLGEDDILALPSSEDCEVSIFRSGADGWVAESSDKTWAIEDQEAICVRDQAWRICLPVRHLRTTDATVDRSGPSSPDVLLDLFVSRDGEHIGLKVTSGTQEHELDGRAHLALLLELARVRLSDASREDLPPSEHGWVHREDLLKELRIDPPLLHLWTHRSRQQLGKILPAHTIFERRSGAQQLRIGIEQVRIHQA